MKIKPIMLIILIMLIKKVAQSCHLGNKPKFVQWHHNNMNQSKHLTLLIISRSPLNIWAQQLDYKANIKENIYVF